MPRIKQIVGLDIGARNVRAVWVALHKGAPRIVRREKMALPLDGGDSLALIRAWLAQLGLSHSFAAVAANGAQVVFQPARLTPDDPRTTRQAAEMEVARFNDMVGDSMAFGFAEHEWTPGLRVYLMGLIRPLQVESALAELSPIAIRPAELLPSPVALFNSLAAELPADDELPHVFINVGHAKTDVAIGSKKGILFARTIEVGGKIFTETLAKKEKINLQQAELLKHRESSLIPEEPFYEELRPAADRILNQISACLSAYRASYNGDSFTPATAIIVGGGAAIRGFDEVLAERLRLPVKRSEDEFAVAAGLALCALDVAISPLSLLPPHLRDEVVFREKKPYWIAAAITGALALSIFTIGLIIDLKKEAREIDAEREALMRREKIDKAIAAGRRRGDAIRRDANPLHEMLLAGPRMRDVVSLVAQTIGQADWVTLICEETSYFDKELAPEETPFPEELSTGAFVPGFRNSDILSNQARVVSRFAARNNAGKDPNAAPAPPAASFNVFIIEGFTPDPSLSSVKETIARMAHEKGVKKVDLLADDRVQEPTLPAELQNVQLPVMRRFVIRLETEK